MTEKFPGAYKATDPYANFSIYNGRKAFPMPGPAVWTGGASGSGSSSSTTPSKEVAPSAPAAQKPTTMATVVAPKPTPAAGAGCAALYGQCGGQGFNGAKCCSAGSCKAANQWYSQCLN